MVPTTSRELRIQSICIMILATVATGTALHWLQPVLVPFALALFFACGLAPVLDLIERRFKAPRGLAVAIAFLLGLGMMAMLWLLIYLSVASLAKDSKVYKKRWFELESTVQGWVTQVSDRLPSIPGMRTNAPEEVANGGGFAPEEQTAAGGENEGQAGVEPQADPSSTTTVAEDQAESSTSPQETSPEETHGVSMMLIQYLTSNLDQVGGKLQGLMFSAMAVLIFLFFLLLGGSTEIVPRKGMWLEIEAKIRGYIVTKSIISAVTGFIFGFVLWIFGVPLAVVFGLLAFLLNFIPNIGPIIALIFPLPLILLDPEMSIGMMVLLISLIAAVQFISGNIIEPKVMGDTFELHPVAILLTLMIWGMIWGIVGMFLATPLMAAAKIVLARFDRTRPVAELLAGKLDVLDLKEST